MKHIFSIILLAISFSCFAQINHFSVLKTGNEKELIELVNNDRDYKEKKNNTLGSFEEIRQVYFFKNIKSKGREYAAWVQLTNQLKALEERIEKLEAGKPTAEKYELTDEKGNVAFSELTFSDSGEVPELNGGRYSMIDQNILIIESTILNCKMEGSFDEGFKGECQTTASRGTHFLKKKP